MTHYSSLIFALTLGIYALVRLRGSKANGRVIAAWGIGQAGALAICGFLYYSHIAQLRHSALPQQIADTWLRNSIFHPGQDHVVVFVASRTVRLFRYLFSNGTIGFLALLVFLCGILLLMLDRNSHSLDRRPTPRQLALLLSLPFLITAGVAVAGIYPYGGTRHDVLLSIFAMSGIAVGLGRLKCIAGVATTRGGGRRTCDRQSVSLSHSSVHQADEPKPRPDERGDRLDCAGKRLRARSS